MSVLVTSIRKTDSSRLKCNWSGDFSAQTHLKLIGRDIDPPHMIGQCWIVATSLFISCDSAMPNVPTVLQRTSFTVLF